MPAGRKPVDLTGLSFGRLTVLSLAAKVPRRTSRGFYYRYRCQCQCGKSHEVDSKELKSGRVKSCGCWRVERLVRWHQDAYHSRNGPGTVSATMIDPDFD